MIGILGLDMTAGTRFQTWNIIEGEYWDQGFKLDDLLLDVMHGPVGAVLLLLSRILPAL